MVAVVLFKFQNDDLRCITTEKTVYNFFSFFFGDPAFKMPEGKFFVIQSCMNDLVLDIQGSAMESGTPVITWENNEVDHQIWSFDHAQNVIRSKKDDDYVLEVQGIYNDK